MGPGFRPVLPFRGRGVTGGQPDALLAPDLGLGNFSAYRRVFNSYGMSFRVSLKTSPNGGNSGLSLRGGVTTLPFLEKSASPRLRLQHWLTGAKFSRGQGCNNARTPGYSLVFVVRIAILKNAAGTLCNVASFMLPFSSTSGFRSCGSGCQEFSSSPHSQCARRSHVPGLF